MRTSWRWALAAIALGAAGAAAPGTKPGTKPSPAPGPNRLTNGGFEARSNPEDPAATFPGWAESDGAACVVAPKPLVGKASAHLVGGAADEEAGAPGNLVQRIASPIAGSFSVALKFAAVAPAENLRTMNLIVGQSDGAAQINLRVVRGTNGSTTLGTVQVYDGTEWQPILTDAVKFSAALANPVANTLSITGTVGGEYTVKVNNAQPALVSHYQEGAPTNLGRVEFHTDNGPPNSGYVVDDVTFGPPATPRRG